MIKIVVIKGYSFWQVFNCLDKQFGMINDHVKESHSINGKTYSENPINSVEHLIKEITVFFLFGCLFSSCIYVLKNDENDGIPINRKLTMVKFNEG